MNCSCKELKKPPHPQNVRVEFYCNTCGTTLSEVVWYHSTNWRLQTPKQCELCNSMSMRVDRVGSIIKRTIFAVLRLNSILKRYVGRRNST